MDAMIKCIYRPATNEHVTLWLAVGLLTGHILIQRKKLVVYIIFARLYTDLCAAGLQCYVGYCSEKVAHYYTQKDVLTDSRYLGPMHIYLVSGIYRSIACINQ
jgi:hypothetical protein